MVTETWFASPQPNATARYARTASDAGALLALLRRADDIRTRRAESIAVGHATTWTGAELRVRVEGAALLLAQADAAGQAELLDLALALTRYGRKAGVLLELDW